jgi:hypothetical protein
MALVDPREMRAKAFVLILCVESISVYEKPRNTSGAFLELLKLMPQTAQEDFHRRKAADLRTENAHEPANR